MQSTAVLNSLYCGHLSEQLAAQEERQKKQKKGQLNGDGLPRLLMGEEFYTRVVQHEETVEQDQIEHKICRKQKEIQSRLMTSWKEQDNARKQRNKEQKTAYHEALCLWKEERELAKQEKRWTAWSKLKRGKLEAPIPKPVAESGSTNITGDGAEGDDGNASGEEDDDGTRSDGESEEE
ncbi:hypothetical protein HD554DRAFT_2202030 [Boletus coccyginus]|nr:hypothetical protein HD554DRAFT_2202030 [Boletus coccyginus]